jgi:hypothetical protein
MILKENFRMQLKKSTDLKHLNQMLKINKMLIDNHHQDILLLKKLLLKEQQLKLIHRKLIN